MEDYFKKRYFYESIPDRLFPFATEIEGKLVRGQRAYQKALEDAFLKYGPNRFGIKLMMYRTSFHLMGSIVFVIMSTFISEKFFGSETALYVLLAAAVLALTFQEFYSQPKRLGQLRYKGITDWLSWVVPMMILLLL
jgi:hypothetical protein